MKAKSDALASIMPVVPSPQGFAFSWRGPGDPGITVWCRSAVAAEMSRLRVLLRIVRSGKAAVLHDSDGGATLFSRLSNGLVVVESLRHRVLH